MGLAFAGEDRNTRAAYAFRLSNECAPVACIPTRRCRDGPDAPHVQDVAQSAESSQCIERRLDGVGGQQPGRLNLSSEAREHLLIEDRRRRARQAFVDDEADRVRADVDNGNRRPVVKPALRG